MLPVNGIVVIDGVLMAPIVRFLAKLLGVMGVYRILSQIFRYVA